MREVMLVIHFIGLAMALGIGVANLVLGSVGSRLEPAERGNFMSKIAILGQVGRTGLGLLLLSGFGLMTPYWRMLGEMPLLITKLSLVGVLLISVATVLFLVSKAKKQGNPAILAKIKPLGLLNFLISVVIVILAVLIFH